MRRPVDKPFRISTKYGWVKGYPLHKSPNDPAVPVSEKAKYPGAGYGFHTGIDYVSDDGGIIAPQNGTITATGYDSINGNFLVLISGHYRHWFAHIKSYKKKSGTVKEGELLAIMGETGAASGVHCHHGLRVNGVLTNPEKYIENAVTANKRIVWKGRRNYAFIKDSYIVHIPSNKKAGTILHKRGEVVDVGEYTEWPNGKRFYRAKKQVADKDMRGYGKSKLVRIETAKVKKVTF